MFLDVVPGPIIIGALVLIIFLFVAVIAIVILIIKMITKSTKERKNDMTSKQDDNFDGKE